VYAVGLWLLSRIDSRSPVVPDVLVAILVFAIGMATFSAPLATTPWPDSTTPIRASPQA
jgi:hypothetical protein